MSIFNECLIHLCDCTWLNMFHMLNYMLIKHRKIFECFNCFWKVFLFWKILKTVQPYFGDLPRGSSQSWAYLEGFRDFLVGQSPSLEKDLEKFQKKSGFLEFLRLMLVTYSWVEAPVARVTQKVSWLPTRLTREWNFQSRKTLRQIFQILSQGFLATCLQLISVVKIVCFEL